MSDDKQKQRSGETTVTSVSVSKEFGKLIDQYNLSPTECFRRGVAVTLYDLGVGMYQSDKNKERSKYMHEFLQMVSVDEENQKQFDNIELFKKMKSQFKAIKKIIDEIEK